MQYSNKKQILLNALSETVKELRGEQSQFKFASENDIPISIISTLERGIKDPQYTTLYKLAEACSLSLDEFMKKVIDKLPKDFTYIDK